MVYRNKSSFSMDYVNLGCCALAFVLYLNTLNAGFVYDDRRAILGNPDVMGATTSWYQLVYNDFWGTPLVDSGSHGSYRPLCVLSFKLNHIFGGFKPLGYHLVNVLLHCLATGLVVKLARHILPYGFGTLISGLLFASHPIHTETVAGIVGRADLIACNFYILTLLSYIRHVQWREKSDLRHWFALGGAIFCASAAVLCKETAISALIVCGVYDFLKRFNTYSKDKLQLRSIGILGIAFGTILRLRLTIPGPRTQFSTADNPTAKLSSILTRFYTFTYLPVFNFKLLVYPQTLSFDWGMDAIPRITSLFEFRNIISLIFYVTLGRTIIQNLLFLHRTIPKIVNSKRLGRSIYKRKHQIHQPTATTTSKVMLLDEQHESVVQQNQLCEHESNCMVCKPGINIRHSSVCRANNRNNSNLSTSNPFLLGGSCGGCSHIVNKFISLSPLKQYISNNKNNYMINNNNNNNNNNTSINNNNNNNNNSTNNNNNNNSEIMKDNNNNNCSAINNDYTNLNGNLNGYQTTTKHSNWNHKQSVKNISNKLIDVANHLKSVEQSSVKHSKLNSESAILISITILTLPFLPAANLFFYVGFVVAERILYLPSVGYCLLIGLGLGKLINFKVQCKNDSKSKHKMDKLKQTNIRSMVTILFLIILVSAYSIKTIRRNRDWHDEESLYRSAIKVNPPKALGNLGSVLSSQGRFEEARIALLEALKHRPNMADVHYNLGILYQNQQMYEDAVGSLQKAIHFRPSLALAYLNLGTSLIALGRCHEAASVLRDGTKLDGTGLRDRSAHENARISSLLQLGGLYADQGKLQRAKTIYIEALETLPKNYPPQGIYHRLGDIFVRLKKWSEAERFHRAALEAQPDHIGAHISYGTMLARNSSRSSEAEQYFKRALRLAPLDSSVHYHYAEFLSSVSRHEEACESRIRAADLSPNDYSLVVSAATALRMLDRKVEAEKWYRQAVNLRPDDARAHTNLGAILHLLGRTQQATLSYKIALDLQPGDPTTLGNLEKLGVTEVS